MSLYTLLIPIFTTTGTRYDEYRPLHKDLSICLQSYSDGCLQKLIPAMDAYDIGQFPVIGVISFSELTLLIFCWCALCLFCTAFSCIR